MQNTANDELLMSRTAMRSINKMKSYDIKKVISACSNLALFHTRYTLRNASAKCDRHAV